MALDTQRLEWERAYREIEGAQRRRQRRLLGAVDAVGDELRRRIGQTYTLAELAAAYDGVERWGRAAVAENAEYDGWAKDLAVVEDATFHLFVTGAVDYDP